MKEDFKKFFEENNGKYVEVNDPTNLYQCLDLCYKWCDFLNIPRDTIRHLYAYQVYTEPNDLTVKYFEIVPNTPAGIPPCGSLVIFNSTAIGGTAGHISIASGEGDTNGFNSFDQNFGSDKHCRMVSHGYSAVLGWLRPRTEELNDDTKKALDLLTQYQQANGLGNLEASIRDLVGKASDLVAVKNELIEYKNGENSRIESAVSSALMENDKNWQIQLSSANKTIQDLNMKVELLTVNQAENLTYSMLFSIAWRKFWKRG
jgi:hypothetical protein